MKQNFPYKLSQHLTGHQRSVWSGVFMMKDNTFPIIQFGPAFFQLPCVTTLVVRSRLENQSSDQLEVAHGGRFLFNRTADTTSPC